MTSTNQTNDDDILKNVKNIFPTVIQHLFTKDDKFEISEYSAPSFQSLTQLSRRLAATHDEHSNKVQQLQSILEQRRNLLQRLEQDYQQINDEINQGLQEEITSRVRLLELDLILNSKAVAEIPQAVQTLEKNTKALQNSKETMMKSLSRNISVCMATIMNHPLFRPEQENSTASKPQNSNHRSEGNNEVLVAAAFPSVGWCERYYVHYSNKLQQRLNVIHETEKQRKHMIDEAKRGQMQTKEKCDVLRNKVEELNCIFKKMTERMNELHDQADSAAARGIEVQQEIQFKAAKRNAEFRLTNNRIREVEEYSRALTEERKRLEKEKRAETEFWNDEKQSTICEPTYLDRQTELFEESGSADRFLYDANEEMLGYEDEGMDPYLTRNHRMRNQ